MIFMYKWKGDDQVYVRDLCCVVELAQRLNVPDKRLYRWIERRDSTGFPEPVYQYKSVAIYNFQDVEVWMRIWYQTRRQSNA